MVPSQHVSERGTGVQVVGDGNTVILYTGSSELHLTRKHRRTARPKADLELLRVDLRATTLLGRSEELTNLQEWLTSSRNISVRCISGRAGVGKTRIGLELCALAETKGWVAGFARQDVLRVFLQNSPAAWRWTQPTLVVVDYAAASVADLRAWLEILAQREFGANEPPLRLLLLERNADLAVGWWAELTRPAGFSDPPVGDLLDPGSPIALSGFDSVQHRRALLAQVMAEASRLANVEPALTPPPTGADPEFDRQLSEDARCNEPLHLVLLGLDAVATRTLTLSLSRVDLANRIADRERARLELYAKGWKLSEALVTHLVACITLEGGCEFEAAAKLSVDEQEAMGLPESVPTEQIVSNLAETMSERESRRIDAVRPNLVGEAFFLKQMQRLERFPAKQDAIISRAWERARERVAAEPSWAAEKAVSKP